jgi:predicted RNA binding protein YcfA (HicA-like mRNA interferase family)
LEKAGWRQVRRRGSHRIYRHGDCMVLAFHDREDLGRRALAKVAQQTSMTVDQLRRLL